MLKQTKITDYFKPLVSTKETQKQINFEYLHNKCLKIIDDYERLSFSNYSILTQTNLYFLTEYVLALSNKFKNT